MQQKTPLTYFSHPLFIYLGTSLWRVFIYLRTLFIYLRTSLWRVKRHAVTLHGNRISAACTCDRTNGVVWQKRPKMRLKRRPKIRQKRPKISTLSVTKSDSAKYSLSFSRVWWLLHFCSSSRLNASALLHNYVHRNAYLWYPLISRKFLCEWRDRLVQRYSLCRYNF